MEGVACIVSDTPSSADQGIALYWEHNPHEVPMPVNRLLTRAGMDLNAAPDSNIILKFGFFMPPSDPESIPEGAASLAISGLGSYVMSLQTARELHETLGDVIEMAETEDKRL